MIKIKVKDLGKDSVFLSQYGTFVDKKNIYSLESGNCVSWYEHDIFKKLNYIYAKLENNRWTYFLEENRLYNKRKLSKLVKSKNFKTRSFAFFRYDEVERLLGLEITQKRMSGLGPI